MIEFHCEPPLPAKNTDQRANQLFVQTIRLVDGDRTLARAGWAAGPADDGTVQILELWTEPAVRRSGYARRMMLKLVEQARILHKTRKINLRRLWIGLGHKTQVIGRSFLTSEGFHHVGSAGGLLVDQDLVIYVKSVD